MGVYATLVAAETEDGNFLLATGVSFQYNAASLGGLQVFYRMEKSSGEFIIDSYILPTLPGVYDVSLVLTQENIALAEILSTVNRIETKQIPSLEIG